MFPALRVPLHEIALKNDGRILLDEFGSSVLPMVFKLMQSAQKRWRALNGSKLITDVITGVRFVDGVKQQTA